MAYSYKQTLDEVSITRIIKQLRVLSAAVRRQHTPQDWQNLKQMHELIDYSDFEPAHSNSVTKKTLASADVDLTKQELVEFDSAVENFNFPPDIQNKNSANARVHSANSHAKFLQIPMSTQSRKFTNKIIPSNSLLSEINITHTGNSHRYIKKEEVKDYGHIA